jgi:hypothetical protein
MDHGLYDLHWWIPRRYSFEGEATVGSLASFPVQIDWTVDNVRVNEVSTLIPETIPEGWTFRQAEVERDQEPLQVTVLVPPPAELALSTELPEGAEGAASNLVREEELDDLRRTLMGLDPPASLSGLEVDWGFRSGLTRYNRIEGLSIGVAAALPLPSFLSLRAEARIGFADRAPRGEVSVHRETPRSTQRIGIYRRLDPSSEWATAHGLAASLGTLLWGSEWTPYHRSWGAEAVATTRRGAIRGQIRLFAERHDTAERRTHAHLARLWNGHELPENPPAMEGSWHGAAAGLRWDVGDDPLGPRAFGRFEIEGSFGRTDYGRAWTSLGIGASALGLSAVLEGGVGGASGRLPAQRRFLPGGPASFRGARAGELSGEAFWFARGEIGRARPALKLVTFVDWLAVGPRDALWHANPGVAVGAGASLVDGLVRVDLARNLRGDEDWKLFVYLDGLF